MKNALLFALLLTLGFPSFGQKIHFTDTTNVWHGYIWDDWDIPYYSSPFTENYIGDTIIHGTAYKTLNSFMLGVSYIREDTVSKKVYAIRPIAGTDTAEKLLYDYKLNVGDTFKTSSPFFYVTAIDSVIINSIWHKTWHFHSDFRDYDVIEGIGSTICTCLPLNTAIIGGEAAINLTCFNNDGTTPPLSKKIGPYFDNTTSCSVVLVPLSVNKTINKNELSSIFPNPIDETSKITLPYTISSGEISVSNDIGQTIINTSFQNKEELLIGDKIQTPGIYFYRVMDNQRGQVFSGKFMCR
jgi:hypothetical protein